MNTKLTDMEKFYNSAKEKGLEPSIIGNTVQWTNPVFTVIHYFDANGKYINTKKC
jgi:hypothetical protein